MRKTLNPFLIIFAFMTIIMPHYAQSTKTIYVNNIAIEVIMSDSIPHRGDILVLPGWNFGRLRWCNESSLCNQAIALGYRLVLPEMGKSIYASHYFPETRLDWRQYPTLSWVLDTLIPTLQLRDSLFNTPNNFIMGLSTGGRGAVLIAEHIFPLFIAGAALSGDYDQTKMPDDNLMKGFYGSYYQFSQRWNSFDNPSYFSKKLNIPFYLGHGMNDKVVPFSQTKDFYYLINQENPSIGHQLVLTDGEHNFEYWDSQVEAILTFFEKFRK